MRLFVGGWGTLGLVTEAVLKPTIVPESVEALSVYYDDLEALAEDVVGVWSSRLWSLFAEFPTRPPRRWCVLGIGTSCSSAWT